MLNIKLVRLFFTFLVTCLFCVTANAITSERRVALVIGNGNYEHAVALPNPVRDAQLMASTFRAAGFEIFEGFDLDRRSLNEKLDDFTEAAYEADLAIVYYAGHGMQVDGKNYVIPIDAQLTSPAHLRTRAVNLNDMLDALPPDPSVGIVILDACRDNPLSRSLAASFPASRSASFGQGLAPVDTNGGSSGSGGILVAYATDPGSIALDGGGANSPYTEALARHIATPGLEIQSALTRVRGEVTGVTKGRQRPWHNASLGKEIFIGGPAPTNDIAAAAPNSAHMSASNSLAGQSGIDIEKETWEEASKRHTIDHYELYLLEYPNGHFANMARVNIKQLSAQPNMQIAKLSDSTSNNISGNQVRSAIPISDTLLQIAGTSESDAEIGLDQAGRMDLQLRLRALDYYKGGIDGAIGKGSRNAIGSWQRANSILETKYLTTEQYNFLVQQTDPLMTVVRANYEASIKRKVSTSNNKSSNSNNGKKNKFGGFAAGVAAGAIGCKLLKC